jgi:hypothetical protein
MRLAETRWGPYKGRGTAIREYGGWAWGGGEDRCAEAGEQTASLPDASSEENDGENREAAGDDGGAYIRKRENATFFA